MSKSKTWRKPPKPKPTACDTCQRQVLAGLDARVAALPVVIDAEVLTREGELLMILASVKLYGTDRGNEIVTRTSGQVLKQNRAYNIHRVHDCDQPTPAHLVAPPPTKPAAAHYTEKAPF
jgi:hypothetical protein